MQERIKNSIKFEKQKTKLRRRKFFFDLCIVT